MDRESYLEEIKKRFTKLFIASKGGRKISDTERHRLQGFMQAGVFLQIASNSELNSLMQEVYFAVNGQTIAEKRNELPKIWTNDGMDFSKYDVPPSWRGD